MRTKQEIDKAFEIIFIQQQIALCSNGIENGNWEGYSENLSVRKQKLKELQDRLNELENENTQI